MNVVDMIVFLTEISAHVPKDIVVDINGACISIGPSGVREVQRVETDYVVCAGENTQLEWSSITRDLKNGIITIHYKDRSIGKAIGTVLPLFTRTSLV